LNHTVNMVGRQFFHTFAFDDLSIARIVADTLRAAFRETGTEYTTITVGREVPMLGDVSFTNADVDMLQALAADAGNRVAGIKWLRATTGVTLKEAKDWLDENFPRPAKVEPANEAPSLVDIFRAAAGIDASDEPLPPVPGCQCSACRASEFNYGS
jgi:ribosomal protein L7/L12